MGSLDRLSFTDQVNPQRDVKEGFSSEMGSLKITVWLVGKVVARVWKPLGCLRVE